MNIEEKEIGSLLLLRLRGEFSAFDVPDLHNVFEQAIGGDKRIVVEIGFAKAPSYSILVPLLTLAGTLHAQGDRLIVAKASGNLRFLLTMLNKQDWFEFHEAINDLVIEESNKQTAAPRKLPEENVGLKPVFYHIPDVTDFNMD